MLPEVDILLRAAMQCEVSLAVRNRALALFHHFNLLCSENAKKQHDMVMLTAAALKCAARYEEEDLDYDSIILIYYCLVNKTLKVPSAISPEYMAIKSSLMTVDHIFCRMLSFDFSHRLAHEFLLPFLTFILERHPRLSKYHEKVSVTSVRFANDAYTHPLSITFKPDHLAVACIHAAFHVYGLLNKLLLVEPWYQGLAKDMTVGKLREIKIFLFNLNEEDAENDEEDWVPEEDKIPEESSNNQPTNPTDSTTSTKILTF